MANPTVEKLQALGLKHGEKAVVGLAVVLFLLFVVSAITKPTIQMKPEDLQKKAEQADSNLNAPQKPDDILAKLVEMGVKPKTEFEQVVEKQQSKALNPAEYTVKSKWVTPEPGAGLIRDTPVLIAVTDLNAFPNRGGYVIIDTDKEGKRIVDDGKDAAKRPRRERLGRRRRGGGGMMGMGGGSPAGMMAAMAGGGGMGANLTPKQKQAAEARAREEEARLAKSFAGKVDPAKEKADPAKEADPGPNVVYKESTKGLRSVVVTGVLDYKTLRANYLTALKNPAVAYPNFIQVEAERQVKQSDGSWGEFEAVNEDENLKILENLTEVDEELVPKAPGPLIEALVDPLPFPKAGYWNKVHVISLIPEARRHVARNQTMPGGMEGMMGMGGMGGRMTAGGPGSAGMMGGDSEGMTGGKGRAVMGGGAMMPGGGEGGPADDTNFEKSEADTTMVRSLDFTVRPDTTYKYRVRLVVVNPNKGRTDVSPGTDVEAGELKGPWSEPTGEVTVPADVSAYALSKAPPSRREDQVSFQVAFWDPVSGHTVTRTDQAGPGELIGESATTDFPSSDGTGKKARPVDFNSHQVVLDTMGGPLPPSPAVKATAPFEMPALALVVRPDGAVAVHSQPADVLDDVRKDMDGSYKKALRQSTRRRERTGMMGMMPGGPR